MGGEKHVHATSANSAGYGEAMDGDGDQNPCREGSGQPTTTAARATEPSAGRNDP